MTAKKHPVVQAPVRALAQVDMPATITGYLHQALGSLNIELATGNDEQAWTAVSKGMELEAAGKILAGRALVHLRQTLDSGAFSAGLAERSIPRRTAYDAIDTYALFASLPDGESVRALAQLGVTKSMSLARWPTEQIAALAHGEEINGLTIEQAAEMSTRELDAIAKQAMQEGARVKALESENLRLKERLELSAKMAKDLGRLEANEAVPLFAREVREEAMFVSETMMISLQSLEDTADASLFAEIKHPERMRWQTASARTLYHALATPVARALALMERAKAVMGDDSDTALVVDSQLEPSELKRFETMRDALLQRLQAEKQDRDDQRANTQPGRRGRRRGSKG